MTVERVPTGPDYHDEFVVAALRSFDELARALHVPEGDLQATLDAIVTSAVATVAAADHAGLILAARGALVPQATTGPPPRDLDAWQQKHGVGPCLETAERQSVTHVNDCLTEDRWLDFGAHAVSYGVRSMLCVPLSVDGRLLGAVSLYANAPSAFSAADQLIAELFATLSAVALSGAQRVEQLRSALARRDVIGQAKGVLVERHRITSEAAFKLLADASMNMNRRLYDVAEHLVQTGELLQRPLRPEADAGNADLTPA